MSWIVVIVVGGIIGWLASILAKTNAQMGILANVLVGIVGSALGTWLAGLLGFASSSMIINLVVSVAGAVLLIAILKALGILRK
jgi:uncharacterized membrane protein YeaQ/YmgE (transglycosylase-associated protein family)